MTSHAPPRPPGGPQILTAYRFNATFLARLTACGAVHGPVDLGRSDLPAGVDPAGIRVLVTVGALSTTAAVMDRLPNLGLICCYGSGYENVDLAAAAARGIGVTHGPGANAAAVAELAVALLLAAVRRVLDADRSLRDGAWSEGKVFADQPGLQGRRVGIFGLGAIGGAVARYLGGWDLELAYCGRSRKQDAPYRYFESLRDLAEWADVLVVAARADAGNRHAVDRNVLGALGPQGTIVNVARGSLIDETALVAALEAGDIASAGLDVFEREPFVPEALRRMPQVVLTPHIGGRTAAAEQAMQAMVLANVGAFLAGRPLLTPVISGGS
jgi:glyoxylate reductase